MTAPPLARWGVSADLRPMAGGARNRVLRTVGLAPELVFKTTTRTDDAIGWLSAVHQAAEACGLRVPSYLPSLDGALVEDGWTCEPLIEGRSFAPGDMPKMAPMLAAFHRATASMGQRPGLRSSGDLLSERAGGDVDLGAMPDAVVLACRAAWANVAGSPEAVVHGDLTPANLIWSDAGPALLDWDECRRDLTLFDRVQVRGGTAEDERAVLAWEVACCWTREPARARRLAATLIDGTGS
ncbi:MAG: phosphotransferase [Pseudomonadota bacterium]